MNYQEFLEYIYQRHSGNVKLGLERMEAVLSEMNNPNLELRGIHIAGTNGKGSTAAICESLSLSAGLKTGLNTSPHLVDYRERIRINRHDISFSELLKIYKKWENIFEKYEASFFEITTAMAFYYFRSKKVDTAIFEVGLGGRLDGTNPFKSTVSVITSISLDHPKSLGDSEEKIAFEKAGIIKNKTPVILGKMKNSPKKVIEEIAGQKRAPIFEYGKDFTVSNISVSTAGTIFDYQSKRRKLKNVRTNLIGEHQAFNASVAITAFDIFLEKMKIKISETKIREALQNVYWPGRMQILSTNPLLMIDGAHNEEGIAALAGNLKKLFPDKKIFFVLAILRDKRLKKIFDLICPIASKIFITKNRSQRAAEIDEQVNFVKKHGVPFETSENVLKAVGKALNEVSAEDVIVVTGSLYTISEILKTVR